jgi:hypothetical protein
LLADRVVSVIAAGFALWTLLTQAFLLLGGSFRALIATSSVVLLAGATALGGVVWVCRETGQEPLGERDAWIGAALLVLCLVGACVSLLANRPDRDDVGYVSRAVYFLEHPRVSLDLAYHDHGLLDIPTVYPPMLACSIELLWATASSLTSLPFLTFCHGVASGLGGALIPIAWFLALSRFTRQSSNAFLGAVALVVWLLHGPG